MNDVFDFNYIGGYFSRNKKIYTLAIVVFFIFIMVGAMAGEDIMTDYLEDETYGDSYSSEDYFDTSIPEIELNFFKRMDSYENEESTDDYSSLFEGYNIGGFLNLFMHNFSIDLGCVLGGLLLSIPTLVMAFINGANIGAIFAYSPWIVILFGIIPHGIFEIPSSVVSLAGGFMVTLLELRILKGIFTSKTSVKEEYERSIPLIKDIIISVMIIFVLLFIAAFIETFITPVLLFLIY